MRLLPLEKGSNYHMERVLLFNIGVLATPLGYGPKGGAAQGATHSPNKNKLRLIH